MELVYIIASGIVGIISLIWALFSGGPQTGVSPGRRSDSVASKIGGDELRHDKFPIPGLSDQVGAYETISYAEALQMEFPYMIATPEQMGVAMQRIASAKFEPIPHDFSVPLLTLTPDDKKWGEDGGEPHIFQDDEDDYYTQGFISDLYNQKCRVKCQKHNEPQTPLNYWASHKRKVISIAHAKYGRLSRAALIETLYKLCRGCTTFKPKYLSMLINKYDIKSVLDISAGWGDRLAACLATGCTYIGVDPNSCLQDGYKKMIKEHAKQAKLPDGSPKYQVICSPFEDAKLPKDLQVDAIVTSPPYFNHELFANEASQSVNKFTSVNLWYENFLMPSLTKAWNCLRKGGIMCLHINNTPGQPDYTMRMLREVNTWADCDPLGVIGKVTRDKYNSARPIFMWRKVMGDKKPILSVVHEEKVGANDFHDNITSNDSTLRKEFDRWLTSARIEKLVREEKHKSQFAQILERWYLARAQYPKWQDYTWKNEAVDELFIQEVHKKRLHKSPEKLLQSVYEIHQNPSRSVHGTFAIEHTSDDGVDKFSVSDGTKTATFTLTSDRVTALEKHSKLTGDDFIVRLSAVVLRYISMFAYGRQLSMGLRFYEELAEAGTTIEGMSSPFNSQLIRIPGVDAKYCSLFKDIEEPLGSIGGFFDNDYDGKSVAAFPPRVEPIIEKMVDFCLEQVTKHSCEFTLFLPEWTDASFYKILAADDRVKITPIDATQYYAEDPFTGEVKKNPPFRFFRAVIKS